MWLLPTRGRPDRCQQALDACAKSEMSSTGILLVDPRGGEYPPLRAASNWVREDRALDMADAMRQIFERFPDESFYGWLADDMLPLTPHWDKILEATAGRWFISHANDLDLAVQPWICVGVLPGAICWGGGLVRTVGWWALPGVRQGGIDDAWIHLCSRMMNLKIYCESVIVEHLHYKNGKRGRDLTDDWVRDGVNYIADDLDRFAAWRVSGEPEALRTKVMETMLSEKLYPQELFQGRLF